MARQHFEGFAIVGGDRKAPSERQGNSHRFTVVEGRGKIDEGCYLLIRFWTQNCQEAVGNERLKIDGVPLTGVRAWSASAEKADFTGRHFGHRRTQWEGSQNVLQLPRGAQVQ